MLVTLRHKTVHVGNLFSHHHHYHQNTSVNNTSSPSTFGRRFSSGTSTSSMTIWPVTEALRENLPSILGAESPFIPCKDKTKKRTLCNFIFRCSLHLWNLCDQTFSKIKPLILLSSQFAHTTNTSAIGELVILNKGNNIKKVLSKTLVSLCHSLNNTNFTVIL